MDTFEVRTPERIAILLCMLVKSCDYNFNVENKKQSHFKILLKKGTKTNSLYNNIHHKNEQTNIHHPGSNYWHLCLQNEINYI